MSKFAEVNYMLEVIEGAEPEYGYIDPPDVDRKLLIPDPPIVWASGRRSVWIPSKNIQFMRENLWYPGHAAALVESIRMRQMPILEVPAGRVWKVSPYDVDSTQQEYADGTLKEDSGMVEPWSPGELGEYRATLLDGNHRAAAAMIVGVDHMLVTVGENYWENIDPKDWVKA